tara:strand:+ start:14 stop:826 length:813 start_codon:yes stop_codon:yes gene_type:complete
MSFNNTPITAKIKRTTKGGIVQQPLLDMGAPVKMKASSVAKLKVPSKILEKNRAKNKALREQAESPRMLKNSRQDIANRKKVAPKKEKKVPEPTTTDAKTLKIRKEGLEGMATDDKARKNKTGQYKPTTKKPYVKKGGKSTGNIKDYKSGSQTRRDEYTARGWKQDATTAVAKPAKTKKIDISNKAGDTEPVAKTVKLTPKTYEVPRTKTKNEIRKNKSIDKKQSKADKARANGNLKKAARKEKAIDKKKARMAKRGGYQGQASNAIKPS